MILCQNNNERDETDSAGILAKSKYVGPFHENRDVQISILIVL